MLRGIAREWKDPCRPLERTHVRCRCCSSHMSRRADGPGTGGLPSMYVYVLARSRGSEKSSLTEETRPVFTFRVSRPSILAPFGLTEICLWPLSSPNVMSFSLSENAKSASSDLMSR